MIHKGTMAEDAGSICEIKSLQWRVAGTSVQMCIQNGGNLAAGFVINYESTW